MNSGYSVRRTIAAPPEQVWVLLADGSRSPEWNPSVLSLDATFTPGERIRVAAILTRTIPGMTESSGQYADGLRAAAARAG
ncbi:SRPBCC family protein [Pseudonocardia sp. N23]|uniref:SRPBCC family protein n=1 Tax=Pseudonocardia sp. N23 TaxID=1987376 RepID=UPI000BFD9393|nr:SRPBCC family protein [Pseudonocardia sp. N23]GAY07458.1 hypothetical protein TOK_3478 [Pseudonocardia sp. N23]